MMVAYPTPALPTPAVLDAPVTQTGTIAETVILTGAVVPAAGLSAAQLYRVSLWGGLTTTLATETIEINVRLGVDATGTLLFSTGAQEPDSSQAVSNVPWSFVCDLVVVPGSPVEVTAHGMSVYVGFIVSDTQAAPTAAGGTGDLVVTLTNSAAAVSVTVNGGYVQRVA